MATAKKRYEMTHHAASGIAVKLVDLDGSTLVLSATDDFAKSGNYVGVAAVLPPPPPVVGPGIEPLRCSIIAYVGQFVGPTTVNVPGDQWSQVYIVYFPAGCQAFGSLLDAVTEAISGGSSPPPGDGTGLA